MRLIRRSGRCIEAALWVVGAASFCTGTSYWAVSLFAQQDGQKLLHSLPEGMADKTPGSTPRPPGGVEAELSIPSIHLVEPILTGCDEATLRRGACRILGTATAGGLGNMGVAGHRDTHFRALENLKVGALASVVDRTGHYDYRVDRVEIVSPEEVEVLDVGDRPELTLITCFPFHFIGAAPRRYIVHAHLLFVSDTPS